VAAPLRQDRNMLVTASVAGAEDLLAASFAEFQIVGYFIAVRMDAKENAI